MDKENFIVNVEYQKYLEEIAKEHRITRHLMLKVESLPSSGIYIGSQITEVNHAEGTITLGWSEGKPIWPPPTGKP